MTTPVKAIRAKCLECSGGSYRDVRECLIPECPLYPFRMGKNPNRSRSDGSKKHADLHKTTQLDE